MFIHRSQSSSIVLLITTIIALVIANSPFNTAYVEVLNMHVATLAGVLVALTVPARRPIDTPTFLEQARIICCESAQLKK